MITFGIIYGIIYGVGALVTLAVCVRVRARLRTTIPAIVFWPGAWVLAITGFMLLAGGKIKITGAG